ncbi:phosphoglucosamine mutase [bacterium BMS3Abin02]|nr:phosphoglucosamine mutase [bacterium BMS3Abin02]GBE21295.1 phosphoglucosamine mutase [bacterium BMS3Bbin01]HDH27153.1 phosphoglucosamine mutase [Actinomycetota bacterium]HDL48883.1 phosphoglucosamine mutase [Actinomycetota bacterium]
MLKNGNRLFGTDGIRGVANTELSADIALSLGRAAGETVRGGSVLVGRDTRRSGEMLAEALQAGFHSVGVDTVDVGVLPTGGISYLVEASGATMGAVVSASHNPAIDNGIKLLDGRGAKLADEQEDAIEARLRKGVPWQLADGDRVGTRFPMPDAENRYLQFLQGSTSYSLRGFRLFLDCANGAASRVAPELFRRLKADVETMCAEPDGTNINDECGAAHPEFLARHSKGRIGLAFDGDADRLIAIDEDGIPANGDVIMAIIARHMKEAGRLKKNVVVATVMANLGFRKAMERLDIELVETQVGDRYVKEAMWNRRAILGGEQSGHVIFADRAVTGDGLLTAVRLLEVVAITGKELRELRAETITEFPQILRNVRVEDKGRLEDAEVLWETIREREAQLAGNGRILVRASGTESLVRIMVEAPTRDEAIAITDELVAITRRELGT